MSLQDVHKQLLEKPNYVQIEQLNLDSKTVLLQIKYPSNLNEEQEKSFKNWAETFKKLLPKSVLLLCTDRFVQIEVHRPKSYNIVFKNDVFEDETFVKRIKEAMADNDDRVNITFSKCRFKRKG